MVESLGALVLRVGGWSCPAPKGAMPKRCPTRNRCSVIKHRPADVVAQPLVVKDKFAYRFRKLLPLPVALEPPCSRAPVFRHGSTRGLDGIGRGAKLVRGDVGHRPGLAGGIRGVASCPAQVPGCGHCMASRSASLHHFHFAACPGPGMFNRLARTKVCGARRLEEAKDVLGARGGPKSQEAVVRIGEGSATADRNETRVPDLGKDHGQTVHERAPRLARRSNEPLITPSATIEATAWSRPTVQS